MAATHCATMLLQRGDHILAGADIYGGTYRLLHKVIDRSGIEVSLAASDNLKRLDAAVRPNTKMLWIESPGNPLMSITDISACVQWAKHHDLLVAIDNTFATPVLTKPLELGVNIVMHSATKYLSGHSDVLGGALVVKDEDLYQRLYFIQNATGAVLSPFDSFLVARGLKTLELRMLEQCRTAMRLAEFLATDDRVARVLYPGLKSHPGHEIAFRQMDGAFGAMLSFEVHGDFEKARRVVNSTKLFQLAVSLGAVESLIEQPASMSHASYDADDRKVHGIKDELIRISVGLEHFDDLRDDLNQALNA
jgi:cystathionine gamma-lyase